MFTGIPFVNKQIAQTAHRYCTRLSHSTCMHNINMEGPSSPTISANSHDFLEQECRKRKRAMVFCPHCNKRVSHTTFYRHKSTFYNRKLRKWSSTVKSKADNDSSGTSSSESEGAGSGATVHSIYS